MGSSSGLRRRPPTCDAAARKVRACAWGSSADSQFGAIVIAKCEKTFKAKLSPAGLRKYNGELQLCAYEFARQEGTISISAEAMCMVDAAVRYSDRPDAGDKPAARASFDCRRAKTSLEHAICDDQKLGQADIVLGRSYKMVFNALSATQKPTLIAEQKKWLNRVDKKCGITPEPLSDAQKECVRSEFESRFEYFDSCSVAGGEECLGDAELNAK